ncbi:MAG: hypothetical protein ACTSRK_09755 [Promethearchaeota archaeon]
MTENKNTLSTVLNRMAQIQLKVEQGHLSLLDIDLIPIFQQITENLSPDEILLGLSAMQSGTSILGLKIEEIRNFIIFLSHKDLIVAYLTSLSSDEEYYHVLIDHWESPLKLAAISSEFLQSSYSSLVSNKPIRVEKKNKSGILETGILKEFNELEVSGLSMKKELEIFLTLIIPKLPQSFSDLLSIYTAEEDYFRHFSYILHLTQEGSLYYDNSTKLFHLGEDKKP